MIRLLLDHGGDINIKSNRNGFLLYAAACGKFNHWYVSQALLTPFPSQITPPDLNILRGPLDPPKLTICILM